MKNSTLKSIVSCILLCGTLMIHASSINHNSNLFLSTTTCVSPGTQPTGMAFVNTKSTSTFASFTPTSADAYLALISVSSSLTVSPSDGMDYAIGDNIGNATVVGEGTASAFMAYGLLPNTTYYTFVFAYNYVNCTNGPAFNSNAPLTGNFSTTVAPAELPIAQPTSLSFGTPTSNSITGSFTSAGDYNYLILLSNTAIVNATPVDNTVYSVGESIGNATVISAGANTSFSATSLLENTTYFVSVYSYSNPSCHCGNIYRTISPLTGTISTTTPPPPAPTSLNYYFGNFHSHSEYSDGTGLPSGDFAYGDAATCMDFLGISEHNHVAAGMALSNWNLGRAQAAAATTSTFLALYGMEWGVISGGGHVLVYGVNDLLGWDPGQYDTFVAKNDYTGTSGLFPTINSFGSNAFATLAHPNNSDYNGIMSTYNAVADLAIVGTAVENGPSTSTNTTYSDPPTSMAYLSFYRNMLARGYHLGPTIDHDNHNVTHGHTALSRTVVLAAALTENDILGAMRQMHFYATEDCSAYVNYKINDAILGSTVTNNGPPTISVSTTTSNPVTSLKIYSGVPGSGTNAAILTSTTTGSINYTHTALANGATQYYYIDITESDGKRTITAPIWYTRNDTP